MNEWPAAIWASISAMTAALVLGFIVVLGALARNGAGIMQEDDNAVAIVKEYRQYSQFNGTMVYSQDIITAIGESRGMPAIWVDTSPGSDVNFALKWTQDTPADKFTTLYLTELFEGVTATYQAHLEYDLNRALIRIEFRRN
ncbi:hypothetical protein BBG47_20005 [Paenibacillus sp. KS1]|uniref:hypothetical protein n=1 Tax=Paenibacillus sp. KS1 TaxID=1849249 RepID=UPI00080668DC|nr:hypothetical protein [Paenibacillus sp. KS1]OBY77776.1 hypothetical protein BBG47_20005 [Paenibacillus sp. KS1]